MQVHNIGIYIKLTWLSFSYLNMNELDQGCPTTGPFNVFLQPTAYSNILVMFS